MRIVPLILSVSTLAACASDFGMTQLEDASGANDDSAVWDSAVRDSAEPEPEPEGEPEPEPEGEPEPEEDPPAADDCEDTSDLIYVIDKDTEQLYLFDPPSLGLTKLGELDCTMWGTPASMAVARDGVAYVRYSDDSVYQLDVDTLACTPTSYGDSGFGSFGMGFATDSDDTWRDALYVANESRLGKLDTGAWKVSPVSAIPSQAELTGNSKGELWAFLPLEQPAELIQLDKDTGAELDVLRITSFPDVRNIDTFAFATWGGDFWLFVRESGMGSSTDVYQVTPTGKTTLVKQDIGINVVGAGVSTCAPTE